MPPIRGHAGSRRPLRGGVARPTPARASRRSSSGGSSSRSSPPRRSARAPASACQPGVRLRQAVGRRHRRDSELGVGATFTLYLPAGRPPRSRPCREAQIHDADDGRRRAAVLVVEDNVEVGRFATQILQDLGYAPNWAANAEAALERLGADGDGFDVVFSDVVMPGMGGIALAEALRQRLPRPAGGADLRATAMCSPRRAATASSCCTNPTRPSSSRACCAECSVSARCSQTRSVIEAPDQSFTDDKDLLHVGR